MIIGLLGVINFPNSGKDNAENRISANVLPLTFDSLKNGSFVASFEQAFSDRFPMRQAFVALSKEIESLKSIGNDGTEIVDYKGANVTETMDASEDGVRDTKWGKILIYQGAAMEINTFDEPSARAYANSINAYAEQFESVKIHSLLVPTQIEFVDNEQYKSMSVSQRETINTTNSFFDDRINTIDVYDVLESHNDEYIYFRTDHHWTQRGAYYAFTVVADELGEKAPLISDYKMELANDYLGSLYNVTLSKEVAKTPDDIEVFYPLTEHTFKGTQQAIKYNEGNVIVAKWLDEKEKYAAFMGGDQPLVEIETKSKTGKNLLVLKDSYANALVPFFVDIADRIIVVDPRMYDGNVKSLVERYEITDILFVNYALITRWDGYSSLYRKVLNKQ